LSVKKLVCMARVVANSSANVNFFAVLQKSRALRGFFFFTIAVMEDIK